MSTTERLQYKIVGSATWELIRAAYLGGESARTCAERFGVSEHAIRRRATKEHWTKRDYAAALEARGLAPPAKPPAPNYVEQGVVREEARRNAEAAAAAAREAEMHALIEKIAAEEEADAIADVLERRALAQASAALVQGRAADAKALAGLAEQMRKRAEGDRAASARAEARPQPAPRALAEEERRDFVFDFFLKVAHVANAMVHDPCAAPAAYQTMIRDWRRMHLGEGEADADKAAKRVADAAAAYLRGDFLETLPEDVRADARKRWAESCAREAARSLEGEEARRP